MSRRTHFHRRRRRRRHPARPLVQAPHARRQLQHRVALGADRAAARRRQARDARRSGRGRAGRSACRPPRQRRRERARPQPEARSADRGRSAIRPRHGDPPGSRTRSCSTSRRASRRRAGPRPTSISTGCSTGWPTRAARPKLVHRLDKDTSGALLVARTRARRRPFRQGVRRPHRAQGLLGAGRRRADRQRRA